LFAITSVVTNVVDRLLLTVSEIIHTRIRKIW